jgi:hypothetical protein
MVEELRERLCRHEEVVALPPVAEEAGIHHRERIDRMVQVDHRAQSHWEAGSQWVCSRCWLAHMGHEEPGQESC